MATIQERHQLYNDFQKEFPIEYLAEMPIERYTNLNRSDSFCYWLESKLNSLGSIWGGSSYKFDIFEFRATPGDNNKYRNDGKYSWYARLGETAEEAFNATRRAIVAVALAAKEGDWDSIDKVKDLGTVFKWKIAFLYSNLSLIAIYRSDMLRIAAEKLGMVPNPKSRVPEIQRFLMSQLGDKDIFEFSDYLWGIAKGEIELSDEEFAEQEENLIDKDQEIIKVIFPDGTVIFEKDARQSYIETLRKIGLAKLVDYPSHHTHYGKMAVSSTIWPESVDSSKYKFIDGTYVYVHYKSAWLKENIETYSKSLNLGITVEMVNKSSWNNNSVSHDVSESEEDPGKRYWWLVASPKYWSFASLGIGDTECYTVKNENGNRRRIPANFDAAKEGDIVIGYEANPVKSIVALAVVSRASDGETIEFKKTESLNTPIEWTDFKDLPELSEMEFIKNKNGSLFKLTLEEYDAIMELIRVENPLPKEKPAIEPYGKEKFLEEVFMTSEDFDRLRDLLLYKKNIILQGAPGVGKTFSAKRLAYAVMGEKDESRVEVVQFHQNYSYEDFIMGYKPDENGFKLKKGLFYEFCYRARIDRSRPYFFIIDEINRGNLSRIFGELLQMIENGYRDKSLRLAYNGEDFSVPSNLHIIGMMNTADRSLAMIDYALRRRFSFFTMRPGFNTDGFRNHVAGYADEYFNRVIAEITDLNSRIANDDSLGEGFCIGHSYFCNNPDVRNVLRFDIKPMIEEYWFDDKDKRETALSRIDDLLK